ncbi:serine-rich single-pass membrane protein 1 [Ornithorhynchus anatinus]|uniref:serine-rich single-pass membrane protein 1 n=1 Tax=Ornithorhynchus anatinus TaxID=9258 RepID=UPI0001554C0B|nr:serine-rich single-pass membrane protein 1 [Ornithorhynchus anatinus]
MFLPFSFFWRMDPPGKPMGLSVSSLDYECGKEDTCRIMGTFLLGYFIIVMVIMVFFRASEWMSKKGKDKELSTDSEKSNTINKAVKDPTCKWHSKFGILDPLRKAPKHTRLSPETDSEVALVNAYLGRRRARILSQWDLHHQIPNDNNSIALANEDSVSQASSWKESESEGRPTLASLHQRKIALRQQNLGSCQIRERPCLHCKAQRTREWLVRHFFQPEQAPPGDGETFRRGLVNAD